MCAWFQATVQLETPIQISNSNFETADAARSSFPIEPVNIGGKLFVLLSDDEELALDLL